MTIRRPLGLLLAAVMLAGCGSTGATATPTPRPTAAATGQPTVTPIATPAAATPAGGVGGGGGVLSGLPAIASGTWNTGQAHLEITGDRTMTYDGTGTLFATNGIGVGIFMDSAKERQFHITLSGVEETGFAFTYIGFAIGATWGGECQVSLTRNDAAGLAGQFSCTGVDGYDKGGLEAIKVDVRGTFAATT